MNRAFLSLTAAVALLTVPMLQAQGDTERASQLVESQCSACHGVDKVKEHRDTKTGWDGVVAYMVSRGLELSDEDQKIIVEYLAKTYPPAPSPAK